MNLRTARYQMPTHTLATLRAGLARYTGGAVAALVTFVAPDGSCAWLVSPAGIVAYGRSEIGTERLRAAVRGVAAGLGVAGSAAARGAVRRDQRPSGAPAVPVLAPIPSPIPTPTAAPPLSPPDDAGLDASLAVASAVLFPGVVSSAVLNFQSLLVAPDEAFLGFPIALAPLRDRDGVAAPLIAQAVVQITPALGEIGIGPGLHRDPGRDLAALTPEARKGELSRALIVGDPVYHDEEYIFPQLDGARAEAIAVGAVFAARPLLGAEATLWAVMQQADRDTPRYIHFATHGVADQTAVRNNTTFVALAGGDRLRDQLAVADGAIVVLSACQSGLGASRPGGMIGLPRLFQLHGAQTVVMSLWNVDDAAASFMMQRFAEELLRTGRAPTAHAIAVRKTRAAFPDPAQWASFAVFGTGPF